MDENRKIIQVLIAICSLFFIIVGYLTYIQLFRSRDFMANTYNRRQYKIEENTSRGNIYDRNGVLLAYSKLEGEEQERIYPYGALYSQVIGYSSKVYGKSQIEAAYNNELLGIDDLSQVFGMVSGSNYPTRKGNNLYLTIDHKLQALGGELLNGRKGAVVAMDPKTGEILALVSSPNFDPGAKKLEENWQSMVESEDAPFLCRAAQGLYAPGSTFKILITAAAIENGMENEVFEDNGSIIIDEREIRNSESKAYGKIDLKKALALSSNVVYAHLGTELGMGSFMDITNRTGFEKEIPFDIPMSKSRFPYESMDKTDLAEAAIGQGKVLVTPLHMAMITSGVANGGIMMEPVLVKSIAHAEGKSNKELKADKLGRIMESDVAEKIRVMMQEVVASGTGHNAAIKGISVAGKTGTAENELSVKKKAKEHSWFVGFAPAEDPKIAVAVIVEYGGSGSEAAVPIAKRIMSQYLSQ
ncbi:peptidoglycan D,D-transpeptidase FtsI family protein [Acetivibrio mesophilus]|uniref:Peptidoglycan glycosyltransferase n=1 Tax=Acetivibrio mesophilus TaxID=2487273 RepID=A0A4Q0I422_9FIRM|nr:penicillin-binding transpeptidase domain-containing protein [Acetivibrio mesophilus]ODM27830.1 peptidoglycan glycosyltransferase [Clostridium sp. Bc-iso-3]RXE59030.1 peptidoglycan glycosyltransferase [Acetivibrio mesophilus]HHV30103.1 peptidoglycan glycosyltransferase [Clostridium sp.]